MAASALATVVGAVLASELGVYGTILGAAVVSVGATTGSAVFQHLFKRTGEQLRNAVERGAESAPAARPRPAPEGGISQEWNAPSLVRAKRRWTWKSYAAASALVFAIAMVPIVAVELAAGKPLHDITTGQDGSGTSFNPSRPSGGQGEQGDQGDQGGKEDGKQPAPAASPSSEPSRPGPSSLPSPGSSGSPAPSTSARPSGAPEPSSAPGAGGSPAATGEASPAPAAGGAAEPGAGPTG
ncbi:hypothetical protein KCH_54500 [Kitasatospora cheerisanensis KCTC 2395]|uniref:Uncharacterized protein n=1 Tax=Kitasatospora cheerisanensis KCTC 2395 TaxID=1348663 RepID=A0A066YXM4_9ACTN|nr:hypothetical protein KCH_54500 [Kitasatospora cheerisanensis KCTC 2395]